MLFLSSFESKHASILALMLMIIELIPAIMAPTSKMLVVLTLILILFKPILALLLPPISKILALFYQQSIE